MSVFKRFLLFPFLCALSLGVLGAAVRAESLTPEKNVVIAAVPGNLPPVFRVDDKTGELGGFGIDVLRTIAKNAGIEVVFKAYRTRDESIAAFQRGEVDLHPGVELDNGGKRLPGVLYTAPFQTDYIAVFVRKGYSDSRNIGDFPPEMLGIFDVAPIRAYVKEHGINAGRSFASPEKALLALVSAEVDGIVLPQGFYEYLTIKWKIPEHFKKLGEPLIEVKRRIMVREDLPDIHRALNDEIKAFVRTETYSRLYTTWYAKPSSGFPFIYLIGAFIAALVIAGTAFFLWRHKLLIATKHNLETVVFERTDSLRQQIFEREATERELMRAKETLEDSVLERTQELRTEMEDRIRAERELRESQQRYRTIFHKSGVVLLLIDPETGSIVDANASACEFYGYECNRLAQMKMWEINTLSPDEVRAEMAQALKRERPRYLFEHRTASGEIKNVDVRPTPVEVDGRMHIFVVVVDVTDQILAEAALRENERLLTAILDNSPSVIHLKDRDGRFLLANAKFRERQGLSAEQVIGKNAHDFLPSETADEFASYDAQVIRERRVISFETVLETEGGGEQHLLVIKFPVFDKSGNIFAVGTISSDISELKRTEYALRHAQRMESIGQLTGGIAHDFNNLLGVIIMNAEYLADVSKVPDDTGLGLGPIKKAAWRGADLTKRLLTFSRKTNESEKTVDLNTLVADMREMLERTLTESVEILIDAAPDIWPVDVEEGGLEDAILNLAINSRDAMQQKGRLIITTKNVASGDDGFSNNPDLEKGDYVFLEVADNGPGMTEEIRDRVFEPFFTTKPTGKGSGLGLSMVYGFVQRAKGDVRIISSPLIGTRVQILLPRSK
jgi:PAS domain S-box-containing protein